MFEHGNIPGPACQSWRRLGLVALSLREAANEILPGVLLKNVRKNGIQVDERQVVVPIACVVRDSTFCDDPCRGNAHKYECKKR